MSCSRTAQSLLVGNLFILPILANVFTIVRTTSSMTFPSGLAQHDALQVTYALIGHSLDVAIIFSSVQYFGVSPLSFRASLE